MIRSRYALILITSVLASAARAQDKPIFTGRWTVEAPTPATGRGGRGAGGGAGARVADMGSGWGSTITIAQDAGKLTVEYAFFSRGDMQAPLKFVYALDGSETTNTVMMGRGFQTEKSKASWDGATLRITTRSPFQNPATGDNLEAEVRRALSLASPTSLALDVTRVGVLGGPTTTTHTVYTKQP